MDIGFLPYAWSGSEAAMLQPHLVQKEECISTPVPHLGQNFLGISTMVTFSAFPQNEQKAGVPSRTLPQYGQIFCSFSSLILPWASAMAFRIECI